MITINQLKSEIILDKNRVRGRERLGTSNIIDNEDILRRKAAKQLGINASDIKTLEITRHSIDARKKPRLFNVYTLELGLGSREREEKLVKRCGNNNICISNTASYKFPSAGAEEMRHRPVIVGMGPAGLFCGYMLAVNGYKPIIIERGYDVETRTKDVEEFWNGGSLKPNSNVQFGEGGAGTFSDGKLNTLIKDKNGRNREVLRIFVKHGAPREILYESKPHIGTDVLKKVVASMRDEIIKNDGSVIFGAKMTSIKTDNGKVKAVVINENEELETEQLVLAIGHSARDTFEYLHKINIPMEAKAFAVGLRVEHKQSFINERMYGEEYADLFPAAPYKLTAKTSSGRGVYSFCMCPGGYVVNASSEEKRLAVNGMSYSERTSPNANSAIIVQVTPEDFAGEGALAGMEFQRRLEEKAYSLCGGRMPVQYFGDYVKNQASEEDKLFLPCIKGGYDFTNLRGLLPAECEDAFIEGMEQFDRAIEGFAGEKVILAGIESRTSSPIRIPRDDTLQCPVLRGLYPCGEGAGYAGGITSAAMDGILAAERIAERYRQAY